LIPWLTDNLPFPPVEQALRSPNGLLAAGGELTARRLLVAYRHGIFPWFNPGDPVLWWSPDPRMVLIPGEFKASRSLVKVLRKSAYEVRTDSAFEAVMRACAAPRKGRQGTWIDEGMIVAYCELHRLGYAHSVEVWMDKEFSRFHFEGQARRLYPQGVCRAVPDAPLRPLRKSNDADSAIITARSERGSRHSFTDEMELVGGLYGVSIGRIFYGESMFSRVSNASKIALAHLARQLERWQFGMIDCQMYTPHLASLGAREISRSKFITRLQELVHCAPVTDWKFDPDLFT
jgi:leucyl/phenylalanyl-tRNA--protein transferase